MIARLHSRRSGPIAPALAVLLLVSSGCSPRATAAGCRLVESGWGPR